jgi:hypothetical protein
VTVAEELQVGQFVLYGDEPRYLRVTGFFDPGTGTLVICLDAWGQTVKLNPMEITDVRRNHEIDDDGNLIEEN